MSVAPGARLGPYEVLAPIGAGGMGEVFRARDTRLERTVALKILPPTLAADRQFRARFDREARAISSLNHPHICTLHDVGEHDGTAFLVMEHVDGETLAACIARGPLPLAHALSIAMQVADALDTAHRRGIVHRDVKPANIMVVRRGGSSGTPAIKLLDFGLARTAPVVASASGEPAQTMTQGLTGAGTILGTLQYMAPEQVEGREADARTDIFALGVVVYEMVTGRKAFDGRTPASVIGAILKEDPPPLTAAQPLAPASLDRVVRHCLAKDPEERWQSARDLKAELQWIAQAELDAQAVRSKNRRRWPERLAWASALALVGALALLPWLRPAPASPPTFLTLEVPPDVDLVGSGGDRLLAIAPDGQRVAFTGTSGGVTRIYLRPIDTFEATPVRGTEGGSDPFFSPDGQTLGFVAERKLKIVPVAGGSPLALTDAANRGAVWTPGGEIVFTASVTSALFRVKASGGQPVALTTLQPAQRTHRWPTLLPDGRTVLFSIQPAGTDNFETAAVAAVGLDDGNVREIIRGGSSPGYLPGGQLTFARGGTVLAVPFDPRTLTAAGTPQPLVDAVSMVPGSGAAQYAVAWSGALVYQAGEPVEQHRELVWTERGEQRPINEAPRGYVEIALSPDGTKVAAAIALSGGSPDVYVYDTRTGAFNRLSFSPTADFGAAWTPDGEYVSYRSTSPDGDLQIVRKRWNGSGPEEVLVRGRDGIQPTLAGAWHRSGRWITFAGQVGDISVVDLEGDRTPTAFLATPAVEVFPAFSPDGRWLAYQSNESGRFEIYVQPFPATGARWQVSSEGGIRPVWARDTRELYFRSGPRMMAVTVGGGSTFTASAPRRLFEGQYAAPYDVSPNGQFLMVRNATPSGPPQLRLMLNWPLPPRQ